MFGPGGIVLGTDLQQSLIPELMEYLKFAHMNQIFVFICLWNGAFVTPVVNERLHGLIKDEIKLQSYIATALTPIVRTYLFITDLDTFIHIIIILVMPLRLNFRSYKI